ncbi:hypothetical protein [Pseudoxanthomonas winnipegensis]|jgi:hypothetical protein|uniref:Peptidase S12 Pab87-related C-terminal domain-containing protein n=1 Tax=Pseudoxanthomonas winnipegensis TaxID=2480810 RepID=A0A4Q8LH38_9GAMM|nr:hypothetical protein [Pseudoxanthomonas winnipegensis]TAA28812.1 hypothetical protein EA660_04335 [Pseudoxanthomonas winnipegensis]
MRLPASLLLAATLCALPWHVAAQAAPDQGVLISQDTLDGYTGRYLTPDRLALRVWREGSVLKLQPDGGAPTTLIADSETTFHTSGGAARVEFAFDAADQVSHLLLVQGGATVKALRQQ